MTRAFLSQDVAFVNVDPFREPPFVFGGPVIPVW